MPYRVLTVDLTITGQVGHATLNTVGPLILQNNLTLYGTNSLNIMGNSGANGAVIFNQAASGKAVTMGANSRINQAYGLFDPVSPANLPVTIGYRQDVGGTIVLSTNFTWANLVSGRTWKNTSTPVGGEWNGRSFAARGAAQVIDGTGAFESGTTNTWLGISPILMGSTVTNADGTANTDLSGANGYPVLTDSPTFKPATPAHYSLSGQTLTVNLPSPLNNDKVIDPSDVNAEDVVLD